MTRPKNVRRGGGWRNTGPSWVRAASRYTYVPANRDSIGFRTTLPHRQPVTHERTHTA